MTILLVEQNARKGLQIADVGVVLDLGTNSFESPASEVLSDPRIQELYLGKRRILLATEDQNDTGYTDCHPGIGIGRGLCPYVLGYDPDFWGDADCESRPFCIYCYGSLPGFLVI